MTTFDAHKDFAYSAVTRPPAPANTGNTLDILTNEGAWFPTPPFDAVSWPQGAVPTPNTAIILRVTAVSGDTFTLDRTQDRFGSRPVGYGDQIMVAQTAEAVEALEAAITAALPASQKGAAGGVATLDGGSKIPLGQLPTTAVTGTSIPAATAGQVAVSNGDTTWSPAAIPLLTALLAGLPKMSTLSASGTLTANKYTPTDATAGSFSANLPVTSGLTYGALVVVEKLDSTANTVTLVGTIRGSSGSLTLSTPHETVVLFYEGSGSFRQLANYLALGSLDGRYLQQNGTTPDAGIPARIRINDTDKDISRPPYNCVPYPIGGDSTAGVQQALIDGVAAGFDFELYSSQPGVFLINGALQSGTDTVSGHPYNYNGQILFPPNPATSPTINILIRGSMVPVNTVAHQVADPTPAGGLVFLTNLTTPGWMFDSHASNYQTSPMNNLNVTFANVHGRAPVDPQCGFVNASTIRFSTRDHVTWGPNVAGTDTTVPTGTLPAFYMPPVNPGSSNLTVARLCGKVEAWGCPGLAIVGENFWAEDLKAYHCPQYVLRLAAGGAHSVKVLRVNPNTCGPTLDVPDSSGYGGTVDIMIDHDNDIVNSASYSGVLINDPGNRLLGKIDVVCTRIPAGQQVSGGLPIIGGHKVGVANLTNGGSSFFDKWPTDNFQRLIYNAANMGQADQWFHPWVALSGTGGVPAKNQFQSTTGSGIFLPGIQVQAAHQTRTVRAVITTQAGTYNVGVFAGYITAPSVANTQNFLFATLVGGKVELFKSIGGTNTNLANSAANIVTGSGTYILDLNVSTTLAGGTVLTAYLTPTITLSAQITAGGGAITSLPINALDTPLTNGATITVTNGVIDQSWTLSASAALGATSLTVTSQTPNGTYNTGSNVLVAPVAATTATLSPSDAVLIAPDNGTPFVYDGVRFSSDTGSIVSYFSSRPGS